MRILVLLKKKLISREVYELIRFIGSQRPGIYGLPKIHKSDISFATYFVHVPFRATFIGEMVNSITYSCFSILLMILCGRLFYFFFHYSSTLSLCYLSQFMLSVDIISLFINVPLD